jgi:hypothetical protein
MLEAEGKAVNALRGIAIQRGKLPHLGKRLTYGKIGQPQLSR